MLGVGVTVATVVTCGRFTAALAFADVLRPSLVFDVKVNGLTTFALKVNGPSLWVVDVDVSKVASSVWVRVKTAPGSSEYVKFSMFIPVADSLI